MERAAFRPYVYVFEEEEPRDASKYPEGLKNWKWVLVGLGI